METSSQISLTDLKADWLLFFLALVLFCLWKLATVALRWNVKSQDPGRLSALVFTSSSVWTGVCLSTLFCLDLKGLSRFSHTE